MKIAILNHSFPPDIGGGESQIYTISNKLHQRGHTIEVFTGTKIDKDGYPFQTNYLPNFKGFEKGIVGLKFFLLELKNSICSKDFDIIFCSNFSSLLAISFLNGLVSGKIVFTFHCGIAPELKKVIGLFNDWDLEICFASNIIRYASPDKIICPSKHFKDWIIKLGAKDKDASIIYNSVDFNIFENTFVSDKEKINWREQNGFPKDAFVFLTPARMYEKKGILDLIRAVAKSNSNSYFLIASSLIKGDSEFSEIVKNEIQKLGIGNRIKVVYDVYSVDEMPHLYKNCDAFILPSHAEMLPVSILEAMASRIPVVCSNLPQVKEIIQDGLNALTFKVKDHLDLANVIDKTAFLSDKERKYLIDNAWHTVNNKFNAEVEIIKLEKIFTDLCS